MVPQYLLIHTDTRRLRETTVDIYPTEEELMTEYQRLEAELRASGSDLHVTLLACQVLHGIKVLGHRIVYSQ